MKHEHLAEACGREVLANKSPQDTKRDTTDKKKKKLNAQFFTEFARSTNSHKPIRMKIKVKEHRDDKK